MTASQFRTLIRAWEGLFVLRLIAGWAQSFSVLGATESIPAGALAVAAVWVVLLLVGLFGMYRFWPLARHFFLGAYLFAFLPWPFVPPPRVFPSGWEVLFEGLGTMLAGLIYGVAVLGPAKFLFERRRANR